MPTAKEIEMANISWIKYLQKTLHWPVKGWDGFEQINSQKSTKPQDKNYGLIRFYGRLDNADLPEETINPILLPAREKIVELLVEDHH